MSRALDPDLGRRERRITPHRFLLFVDREPLMAGDRRAEIRRVAEGFHSRGRQVAIVDMDAPLIVSDPLHRDYWAQRHGR